MRNAYLATAAVLGLSTLLSVEVLACGESLFRVGKGLNYQEYTAPLPGNLLVVASTPDEVAFARQLEAAGHRVAVVSQPGELGGMLSGGEFDIVLARYSQREAVESQLAASTATFLPVVRHDSGEGRDARQIYDHTVGDDDSVRNFLKAIHRTLKQRHA